MTKNELYVEDYAMHLRSLANHLTSIGAVVTTSDLIMHGISGLDSNYNPFMLSFTIRFDCFSFDEFHSQLLTYQKAS